MKEHTVPKRDIRPVEQAIGPQRIQALRDKIENARRTLRGRTIWHVNSTAQGGGVAEMLQPLLAYANGLGLNFRWLVIEGTPDFFTVTKRIHNHIHGHFGDGGHLAERERVAYEQALDNNLAALKATIKPGDVVICHDPQTAGLILRLREHGAHVAWRCHIGHDQPNELALHAWSFLAPYLEPAQRYVFTQRAFIPPRFNRAKVTIIPPSIDPLSAKNREMSDEEAQAILVATGVLEGPYREVDPVFHRDDGTAARVTRCADVIHLGRAPSVDRPLVTQVSRWDALKDPIGVLDGFAQTLGNNSASLVLAGPNVSAVADDPEGGRVLDQVFLAWRSQPHDVRRRIHIACLPMADREENAAIVNALQRHATVVVQKSLYEGFGLTVTEAMWKAKPVVASAVGGICDQITDGDNGMLVEDPLDLQSFGKAVDRILRDGSLAQRMGKSAKDRVTDRYLFTRHLTQYVELLEDLLAQAG